MKKLIRYLNDSWLMSYPKKLNLSNQIDLPFFKKCLACVHCLIDDYSNNNFPIKYERNKCYNSEMKLSYVDFLDKSKSTKEVEELALRTPFVMEISENKKRLKSIFRILNVLKEIGLQKGSNILEAGGSDGWLCEILCLAGYNTTNTSLNPEDIALSKKREKSIITKNISTKMDSYAQPMEYIDKVVSKKYDMVITHGALHHSFDWRQSIDSFKKCLRGGGYLFLCDEPSRIHTYICHRSNKILGTHEIGFKKKELLDYLDEKEFKVISTKRVISSSFPIFILSKLDDKRK